MNPNDVQWVEMAKSILEQEKLLQSRNYPKSTSAIIKWNDIVYIGSIQEIVPEFSKEIVLLSKTRYILPDKLMNTIRKLDKERRQLLPPEGESLHLRMQRKS